MGPHVRIVEIIAELERIEQHLRAGSCGELPDRESATHAVVVARSILERVAELAELHGMPAVGSEAERVA